MPPAATKRRNAGSNGPSARSRDEIGVAVQDSIFAIRRKPLAPRPLGTYSSLIPATHPERKDRTMNASFSAPTRTRIAAFAAAILASTVVLGATVLGMQSTGHGADVQVVALERVVISAPAVN
jgi:hypothetical protein